jgi:peptidoglycan/LPS O-acetylase OafA/YrhL
MDEADGSGRPAAVTMASRPMLQRTSITPGCDLPQLTGVRAVAAFMVFAFHGRAEIAASFPAMTELLSQAYVGVNVFFVLSGFLIYWRYADSATLSRRWLGSYFRRRAARIYPLTILLTLLALWTQDVSDPMAWVRCLTLTQGLTNYPPYRAINVQNWTLTIEECFYFVAPVLFIVCRGRWLNPRLAGMLILFWTMGVCIYGPNRFMVQSTIFGRAFEFFIGMALAGAIGRRGAVAERKVPWMTVVGIGGVLLGMHLMAICDRRNLPTIAWGAANNIVVPIGVAVFFWGLIDERGPIRWLLSTKTAVFLGKISFAFYLVHVGFFSDMLVRLGCGRLMEFILLVVLAAMLYLGVEEPMRKVLRGRGRAKAVPVQAN